MKRMSQRTMWIAIAISLCPAFGFSQTAGHREARRIHKLLTGVEPGVSVLDQMATLINTGGYQGRIDAAILATRSGDFYLNTLVPFANGFTDPTDTPYSGLTSTSAFVVGMTAGDEDVRVSMLGAGHFFLGSPLIGADFTPCTAAQSNTSGNYCNGLFLFSTEGHFSQIEERYRNGSAACNMDVIHTSSQPTGCLIRANQRMLSHNGNQYEHGNPTPFAAGLLTTWTWGRRVYQAGTNRRPIQEIFKLFLCNPLSQARDSTAPDTMVGRDVTRAPAGDVQKYGECRSCHGIIDAMRPAFAWWRWFPPDNGNHDGYLIDLRQEINGNANPTFDGGSQTGINRTLNQNSSFYPPGFETRNRNWVNHAVFNQNDSMGWRNVVVQEPGGPRTISFLQGNGAGDLGIVLGHTDAFGKCMAKRVFAAACKRDLAASEEPVVLDRILSAFSNQGYRFRSLWAASVADPACFERVTP